MDIEKINNHIENINSKEEKLTFLITKIWETLYEGLNTEILDTETLMSLTIQYVKNSFDANTVPTKFKNFGGTVYGLYSKYDGVKLDSNSFSLSTNFLKEITNYAQFLQTISHEFTHRNDRFSNEVNHIPNDPRFPYGNGYSVCLKNLSKIFKNLTYKKVGKALYYCSNNEVVARNVSYNFVNQFAKQLRKITEKRLPNRKVCNEQLDKFLDLIASGLSNDEASSKSGYIPKVDYCSKWMHSAIDRIEEYAEFGKESEEDVILRYQNILKENLQETQQAFFEQCSKYLSGNCTENELKDFNQYDMAVLLTKPEFYNKTLAEKLYQNAQTDKSLSYDIKVKTLGKLSEIKELKIPETERQQNLKNYDNYFYMKYQNNTKNEQINNKK